MKIVSVITNHNYSNLVGEAIESVCKQMASPSRVIVVDDASTDDYLATYKQYANLIEVMRLPERRGTAAAKNVGIKRALEGGVDVIAFLDADDYYNTNQVFEVAVREFKKHDRVGLVYFDAIDANNMVRVWREPFSIERLIDGEDIVGGNFLMNKQAIEYVGTFDDTMRVAENFDMVKRVSEAFAPIHVPSACITIRKTDRALSTTISEEEWQYYKQYSLAKQHGKT